MIAYVIGFIMLLIGILILTGDIEIKFNKNDKI